MNEMHSFSVNVGITDVVDRPYEELVRVDAVWREWRERRWWQKLCFWRRPPSDRRLTLTETIYLAHRRAYESMEQWLKKGLYER